MIRLLDWSKSRLVFSKLEIFKHVIFKTTSVTAELLYPAKKLDASNFSSDPIRNTSQKSGSLQKSPIPTMKKQIFLNCTFSFNVKPTQKLLIDDRL